MANLRLNQFMYSQHKMPVVLDCDFLVGSTGAVGTFSGIGFDATTPIARISAGIYQINFADVYTNFYDFTWNMQSPASGSDLATSVSGTAYVITTVGTSTAANWQAVGLDTRLTPTVGMAFKATASVTITGTGKFQIPKATGSGIAVVEAVGLPNLTINPTPNAGIQRGGYMLIQCLAATASGTTTLVATDPAQNSVFNMKFYLGKSSVSINSVVG